MAQTAARGAAVLLLTLLVAGCEHGASGGARRAGVTSVSGLRGSPAWAPSPAAPGETVFRGVGVRYRPTNETAPVDAAEAVKLARETPVAYAVTVEPTAVLARATDDDVPPGATPAHHDENVLAWVVTYHGTLPALHRSSAAPANCDSVVIVDALRAAVLDMFQTCPGP